MHTTKIKKYKYLFKISWGGYDNKNFPPCILKDMMILRDKMFFERPDGTYFTGEDLRKGAHDIMTKSANGTKYKR